MFKATDAPKVGLVTHQRLGVPSAGLVNHSHTFQHQETAILCRVPQLSLENRSNRTGFTDEIRDNLDGREGETFVFGKSGAEWLPDFDASKVVPRATRQELLSVLFEAAGGKAADVVCLVLP